MDKQNLIERLYALRAAISLLAMQYDKYDRAHRDKLQIYLDEADKFKNIIEKNLYQSKGKYDHYFVFPGLTCEIVSRFSGEIRFCSLWSEERSLRVDFDPDDSLCGKYWISVMEDVRIYDKSVLLSDRHKTKLLANYPHLLYLVKEYDKNFELDSTTKYIDFDENRYEEWIQSYDKQPYESRIVRDYLIDAAENAANEIKYDCISFHKDDQFVSIEKYDTWRCASYLLNSVVCGRWLFSDEARAHFQTKLKELKEIIDAINKDTEKFQPKGLVKLFNSTKNDWLIAQNEESIKLGNIAMGNLQRAIAFLDNEIPKAKALIEEKELEIGRAKKEYVLMLRAIQEEFADVLDKRDWQDVDLLIYYFESGRADDLKEALLQVDNERRTDRIVDTIKEATDRICWTLKTGFDMLNRTLQHGFAAIESRIKQQNILLAQQNQLLAQQNGLMAQQNAELSNLVSAANLSNALLAKQNESSRQLVSKMNTLERVIIA